MFYYTRTVQGENVLFVAKRIYGATIAQAFNAIITSHLFSDISDEMLAKLYSLADVFLYTSYAESFGLPPLEAMACGTPVVMSDNKGSRDYAISNFNTLISQPGDVNSLANNLLKVL
ncbi:glycosyltransferase [Stygiolobus sp. CP8521M]|uniref:glycosyltransferase n=1 Tax=Stygiolobus sp. CP8521M TaxID=3133136 RepID=UPI00307E74BA